MDNIYIKLDVFAWKLAAVMGMLFVLGDNIVLHTPAFNTVQQIIERSLVVYAVVLLVRHFKIIVGNNVKFWIIYLILLAFLVWSSVKNMNTVPGNSPLGFVRLDFGFLTAYTVILFYIASTNKMREYMKIFLVFAVVMCILTDFSILLNVDFGQATDLKRYLIGTKFSVVYLHLTILSLYCVYVNIFKIPINKVFMAIIVVVTALMPVVVDCQTGIIGTLLLILFMYYYAKIKQTKFFLPLYYISLFSGTVFSAFYSFFLSNQLVQKIIVNLLKRELTLTGRTDIYGKLFLVLLNSPWFGYGYGNSYRISKMAFDYANTQNGLAEWLLQIGVLGIIPMLLLFSIIVRKVNNEKNMKIVFPFASLIIVFNFLAIVEVTISLLYLFIMILSYVICVWNGDFMNEDSIQ